MGRPAQGGDRDLLDATKLSDKRVVLHLAREKVGALAGALEVSLARVAPTRSESEEHSFRLRFARSTQEAEALGDEPRRLHR